MIYLDSSTRRAFATRHKNPTTIYTRKIHETMKKKCHLPVSFISPPGQLSTRAKDPRLDSGPTLLYHVYWVLEGRLVHDIPEALDIRIMNLAYLAILKRCLELRMAVGKHGGNTKPLPTLPSIMAVVNTAGRTIKLCNSCGLRGRLIQRIW